MGARFTELVIDCQEPNRVAEFWATVLGYDVIDDVEDNEFCLPRRRVEPLS